VLHGGRADERGLSDVKSFLQREPRVFRDLLHRIALATIGYLKAQIAAGAFGGTNFSIPGAGS